MGRQKRIKEDEMRVGYMPGKREPVQIPTYKTGGTTIDYLSRLGDPSTRKRGLSAYQDTKRRRNYQYKVRYQTWPQPSIDGLGAFGPSVRTLTDAQILKKIEESQKLISKEAKEAWRVNKTWITEGFKKFENALKGTLSKVEFSNEMGNLRNWFDMKMNEKGVGLEVRNGVTSFWNSKVGKQAVVVVGGGVVLYYSITAIIAAFKNKDEVAQLSLDAQFQKDVADLDKRVPPLSAEMKAVEKKRLTQQWLKDKADIAAALRGTGGFWENMKWVLIGVGAYFVFVQTGILEKVTSRASQYSIVRRRE